MWTGKGATPALGAPPSSSLPGSETCRRLPACRGPFRWFLGATFPWGKKGNKGFYTTPKGLRLPTGHLRVSALGWYVALCHLQLQAGKGQRSNEMEHPKVMQGHACLGLSSLESSSMTCGIAVASMPSCQRVTVYRVYRNQAYQKDTWSAMTQTCRRQGPRSPQA